MTDLRSTEFRGAALGAELGGDDLRRAELGTADRRPADRAASTSAAPPVPELAALIRAGIIAGEYAPNQRLIEVDICERFGVKRPAVRDALLQLENEGLVERVPNRGSRVRSISVAEAIEIAELRMVIEGLCASRAASRISPSEIEEFGRLRAAMLVAVDSGDLGEYQQLNRTLHERVGEISGQATALSMLGRLTAQNNRRFRLPYGRDRAAISVREHVAVIDAIVDRDPAAAETAMRQHLQILIDWLTESDDASSRALDSTP